MIQQIKNISLIVCTLSIGLCIFEMISPNKKLQKSFYLTLNLFCVLVISTSIISIFKNNKFDFKDTITNQIKSDENIDESILSIIDNQISISLKNKLKSALIEQNINIKDVEVIFTYDNENHINVDEIKVYVYDGINENKIKEILNSLVTSKISLIYI